MLTNSPKLLKGGIVLMDSSNGAVLFVAALQRNPHSLAPLVREQRHESQQPGVWAERMLIERLEAPGRTYSTIVERRTA